MTNPYHPDARRTDTGDPVHLIERCLDVLMRRYQITDVLIDRPSPEATTWPTGQPFEVNYLYFTLDMAREEIEAWRKLDALRRQLARRHSPIARQKLRRMISALTVTLTRA